MTSKVVGLVCWMGVELNTKGRTEDCNQKIGPPGVPRSLSLPTRQVAVESLTSRGGYWKERGTPRGWGVGPSFPQWSDVNSFGPTRYVASCVK